MKITMAKAKKKPVGKKVLTKTADISLNLDPEYTAMLDRIRDSLGEKAYSHTLRRMISDYQVLKDGLQKSVNEFNDLLRMYTDLLKHVNIRSRAETEISKHISSKASKELFSLSEDLDLDDDDF